MLPNKDIKPEELDSNVCHIQLGAVDILPPEDDSATPVKSLYKQYFNISKYRKNIYFYCTGVNMTLRSICYGATVH